MKQILLVQSGSHSYGVNTAASDEDMTGICLEPMWLNATRVNGQPFEQYEFQQVDGTCYSLRKFVRLAAAGNPNMVEVLFQPVVSATEEGLALRSLAPYFRSKQGVKRHLGYMKAQEERLLGIRGQKDVNRLELVEQYGYDTKYAYHIIRLGITGLEFARTGHMTFPMQEADYLKDVRNGKVLLDEVLAYSALLRQQLEDLLNSERLADTAGYWKLTEWMTSTYGRYWLGYTIRDLTGAGIPSIVKE